MVLCGGAFLAAAEEATPRAIPLSLEQQTKLGEAITNERPVPLGSAAGISLVIGSAIPASVSLHPLPAAAESAVPQLRGYGYVVVEEQIALVEPAERRIVAVLQRWRPQAK